MYKISIYMKWDDIPLDIKIYILKLRNKLRNKAANNIQNFWKFIQIQQKSYTELIPVYDNYRYDLDDENISKLLKFIIFNNIFKLKKYNFIWNEFILNIDYEFYKDSLFDNYHNTYYDSSNDYLKKIIKKYEIKLI